MTQAVICEEYRDILQDGAKRVSSGPLPQCLQAITDRHLIDLAELVEALRKVGIDEEMIEHSVRELVASYEDELVNATKKMFLEA